MNFLSYKYGLKYFVDKTNVNNFFEHLIILFLGHSKFGFIYIFIFTEKETGILRKELDTNKKEKKEVKGFAALKNSLVTISTLTFAVFLIKLVKVSF